MAAELSLKLDSSPVWLHGSLSATWGGWIRMTSNLFQLWQPRIWKNGPRENKVMPIVREVLWSGSVTHPWLPPINPLISSSLSWQTCIKHLCECVSISSVYVRHQGTPRLLKETDCAWRWGTNFLPCPLAMKVAGGQKIEISFRLDKIQISFSR